MRPLPLALLEAGERRRTRSERPLPALTRLLDGVRKQHGVVALTVTDGDGCLVAGAGAWRDCDELAALSPLIARLVPHNDGTAPERRAEARAVDVAGMQIVVSASGDAPARGRALDAVSAGCTRILSRQRRRPA